MTQTGVQSSFRVVAASPWLPVGNRHPDQRRRQTHLGGTTPLRLSTGATEPAAMRSVSGRVVSRTDRSPWLRSRFGPRFGRHCNFLPLICSPRRRSSGAGGPDTLACHALLNAMSSRTKSPEMPLVLYGTVTVLPTDFTGCQRSGTVGPAELETESPQSEMSARSYTVYENCK